MTIIPFVFGMIVAFGAWAYDARQRSKELDAIVAELNRKHRDDHAAWTKYTNALHAELSRSVESLQAHEARRNELEHVVARVADAWQNGASAFAAADPNSVVALRRKRDAQRALKAAAEAAIAATVDPTSNTPVPSSGVVVIHGAKEVANG